jgi:hypothetical protein
MVRLGHLLAAGATKKIRRSRVDCSLAHLGLVSAKEFLHQAYNNLKIAWIFNWVI